ncbi:MAG TPA: hypothetical protein VFN44_23715 [Solirubrobacteraceae bacterium]|nr:hypothetical protein [Solirubrobacteraceae bacterium]
MDELEVLRLRDEVLQAMYWMRSEGLAPRCPPAQLSSFLAIPAPQLAPYLERFAADGLLERDERGFALTDRGVELGKRTFAEEFADLTKPGHGECDDDCWCHDSPEAAAECLAERRSHVHG